MNIAIVGQQCAGKTSLANMFNRPIVKFAYPLYQINGILGVGKSRAFMQDLPALVKKHYGMDKFVKLFIDRLEDFDPTMSITCDDCRRPIEFEALKRRGWKFIYIEADESIREQRAGALGLEYLPNSSGETEPLLLRDLCDDLVTNNSSLEALAEKARDYRYWLNDSQVI